MKSAVENLTATRVKLNVEVPFEELKPSIDAAYKTVASQIQVPGFRKGKVPSKLIDQRVGRGYVLETAINDGLNGWYQAAVQETGVRPLSRPEVEITEVPDPSATDGELKFQVEIDVRPEIELPDYAGIKVEVAAAESSDADVDKSLDELRGRFGTLKTVERPAKNDDFLTIDITATIDGEEIDSAAGLSYQVGAGTMLEGLDEAVTGLSADEEAIFDTTLVGGDRMRRSCPGEGRCQGRQGARASRGRRRLCPARFRVRHPYRAPRGPRQAGSRFQGCGAGRRGPRQGLGQAR